VDDAGNVLKCFSKSLEVEVGAKGIFTGTVVDHKEWKGAKETVLTRMMVGAPKAKAKADKPVNTKEFATVEVPF
jgi:hypothetical protein